MKVVIDGAGRIVIPKPIRQRLHLEPGTLLEVEEGPTSLLLKPEAPGRGSLVRRDGVLIVGGELTEPPVRVDDVRRQRSRTVAGFERFR